MRPKNRLVRLARALSGETQEGLAERTGVRRIPLAQYERARGEPGPENLKRILTKGAGLTVAEGEEVLKLADTLRKPRLRAGRGAAELLPELLAALVSGVYRRLLRLPLPDRRPAAGDRLEARDLWSRL